MPQIPRFEVVLSDQSGAFRNLVGAEAEGLIVTTAINGGCLTARCRFKRPVRLSYRDLGFNYDVRITDSDGVFWRGRLSRWRGVLEANTEYIEITARQANGSDQYYQSKLFNAGMNISTAFATVMADLMPKVPTSSLLLGVALTGSLTAAKRRAFDVLNLLAAYGGYQWGIWPDGTSGSDTAAYQLVLETRPTAPAYYVDIGDWIGTIGFDDAHYANSQDVLFNGGAAWATGANPAAMAAVNATIMGPVYEAPDLTDGTDAAAIATALVAQRSQLRLSAEDGKITNPFGVLDANWHPVALHRIRAGKIIAINGVIPDGQGNTFDFSRNMAYIAGTSYDTDNGELTLTLESFATTLDGLMARLIHKTQI